MSQVGADKLNAQIRANVTNAFASTLFEQVGNIGKQIGTAATGATQISDGTVTLDNGVNQYTVGVSKVHNGIQTMKVAASPLSSGVKQLADGGNQLKDGTSQVANGLGQLQGNIPELSTGVNKLDDGSHQIKGGLSDINNQVNGTGDSDLTGGVQKLTDGMNQLNQSVNFGNGSDPSLVSAVEQLYDGVGQLQTGLKQFQTQTLGDNNSADPTKYGLAKGTEYITNKMLTLQKKVNDQVSALKLATGLLKSNVSAAKSNQATADKAMESAVAGITDPDQKAAVEAAWKKVTAAQDKMGTVLDNGKTLTNDDAKNRWAQCPRFRQCLS